MEIIIFSVFAALTFIFLALAYTLGRPHEYAFLAFAGTISGMLGLQLIASGLDITYALETAVKYSDVYVTALGTLFIALAIYCLVGLAFGMRGKKEDLTDVGEHEAG